MSVGPAQYSSSAGPLDWTSLKGGDLANAVELPIEQGTSSAWVQIAFQRAATLSHCRSAYAKRRMLKSRRATTVSVFIA